MSEINSAEIKVSLDASGVEDGLRKIDDATTRTGRTVDNLGRANGFQQLGVGADVAGTKVDRATKNLAESIQRATAAMQSGTKGSAEYYAALANSRGANLATLKPYLDQLDEVTKRTAMAAEAQKRLDEGANFLESLRSRADTIGKTASELAALRAAQLGVADSAQPFIDQLREAEEASGGFLESLGLTKSGLKAFALGLASSLSIGAIAGSINDAVTALADLDDAAQKTGSSVENLSKLQRVAQMVGQDFGSVDSAISKLAKGMAGLDDDSNKVNAALRRIGVSSKDAAGDLRDPSEVLIEASRNLQNYADGAGKTALINDLLGKSGADLLPYLNDVSESIDDFAGASASAAADAAALQDSIGFLKVRTQEFYTEVAQRVVPAMSDLVGAFGDAAREQNNLVGPEATDWANDLALGLARVADVAVLIPRILSTVGGSFKAVAADVRLMAENTGFIPVAKRWLEGKSVTAEWGKAVAERNEVVQAANKQLEDLWNKPANQIEQSLLKRLNDRASSFKDPLGDKFMAAVDAYGKTTLNAPADPKDAKDRAAAIERQADAYKALVAAINDRVAATAREAAGLDPLTESQKLEARLTNEIVTGKIRITEATEQELRSRLALSRADEVAAAMQKRVEQGNVERARAAKARSDESAKSIADAVREAERNEDLARTFGMTRLEIEKATLARLEEQLAQKTATGLYNDEIEALERVIDAKRRSVAATGSVEAQDAAKRANEVLAADWKRTMDNIDDVFREGFADMLNNGQDGWKSFTKSLVTTFKTSVADQIYKMFAQPFVAKVVANLVGGSALSAVAGSAAANAGPGSGAASALASGAGALLGGGGLVGAGLAGAGWVTGATTLGGSLAAGASLVGTGSLAGGIAGATMIAGALAPIVLGGVLLSKAFGRGPKETTGTSLNGMFGVDGAFVGTTDTDWIKKGGWLRSDKRGVDQVAIDGTVASQFTAGYEALKKSAADFAGVLGINAESIKTRAQALSIALSGDQAKDQEAIAAFFTGVGDKIATEMVPTIAQFAKAVTEFGGAGESASATLQRIAGNYAFMDSALAAIGDTFGAVGLGSVAARERLLELVGGLDSFGKGTAFFAQNFLTEAERLAPVAKTVGAALASMGLSSVDTRDEFKQVVLGLDLTSEAGAKTYASLMGIQEQFALLYPIMDATADAGAKVAAEQAAKTEQRSLDIELMKALGNAEGALAEERKDSLAKLQSDAARVTQAAIYAAQDAAKGAEAAIEKARAAASARAESTQSLANGFVAMMDRATSAAKALRDFNDSLLLGNLSPLGKDDRYAESKRRFESSPGDSAAANAFLQASKDRDAGSLAYARDFAMVQQMVEEAAGAQNRQAKNIEWIASMFLGRKSGIDGSHANGLDYVPFDGYRALLHRGERVQTAADARSVDAKAEAIDRLTAENATMRRELNDALYAIAKHTMNTADRLDEAINGDKPFATKVVPA